MSVKPLEETVGQKVIVFPNPSDGSLNIAIHFSNDIKARIILTDLHGMTKKDFGVMEMISGAPFVNLRCEDLAEGLYLLHILSAERISREKVIITRH